MSFGSVEKKITDFIRVFQTEDTGVDDVGLNRYGRTGVVASVLSRRGVLCLGRVLTADLTRSFSVVYEETD